MDVIEKAKARYAELKAQIEAADAVRPEFEELDGFLKFAEKLQQQHLEGRRATQAPSVQVIIQLPGQDTSDMVEKILDQFGPQLSVAGIISRLKDAGWHGSGDERKDYKNIYNNLSTKPRRFRNAGGAVFERVKRSLKRADGKGRRIVASETPFPTARKTPEDSALASRPRNTRR